MRSIVSDGTYLYLAKGNSLRKITIADGTDVTLTNAKVFRTLTYGNSVLYGADQDGIYSINVSTGALAVIVDMPDVEAIMYVSTTNMVVLRGGSLVNVVIATGAETYISQDV